MADKSGEGRRNKRNRSDSKDRKDKNDKGKKDTKDAKEKKDDVKNDNRGEKKDADDKAGKKPVKPEEVKNEKGEKKDKDAKTVKKNEKPIEAKNESKEKKDKADKTEKKRENPNEDKKDRKNIVDKKDKKDQAAKADAKRKKKRKATFLVEPVHHHHEHHDIPADSHAEVHIDHFQQQIGFGRFHMRMLLGVGLIRISTYATLMGISDLIIIMRCYFQLDSGEKAILLCSGLFGLALAGYFWGHISDLRGRHKIFLASAVATLVVAIGGNWFTTFYAVVLARVLYGAAVAGTWSVAETYVAEFCHPRNLATVMNILSAFNSVSLLWNTVVGLVQFEHEGLPSPTLMIVPWRIQSLLLPLPGLFGLFIIWNMPESPKYLLLMNRKSEAVEVLDYVCRTNKGKSLRECVSIDPERMGGVKRRTVYTDGSLIAPNFFQIVWLETLPLLRPPLFKWFASCCIVMFLLQIIGVGLALWYPTIRNAVTEAKRLKKKRYQSSCILLADELNMTVCPNDDLYDTFITSFILLISMILVGCLIKYLHRVKTINLALILCMLASTLFYVDDHPDHSIVFFYMFVAIPGVVDFTVMGGLSDFLPTSFRAKGLSMAMCIGRLGAMLGSLGFGLAVSHLCYWAFVPYMVLPIIIILYVHFIPLDRMHLLRNAIQVQTA